MSYKVVMLLDKKMPQKDFRIKLLEVMVKSSEIRKPIKRPGSSYKVLNNIRFDSRNHYSVSSPICRCTFCKKIAESVVPNVANLCTLTFALKNFTKNLNNISW